MEGAASSSLRGGEAPEAISQHGEEIAAGPAGPRNDDGGREADGRRGSLTPRDVLAAARDRAGMIMLVTLTTLASLVPLAVHPDVESLFGSIALATLGGTIAGTLGALVVVPLLLLPLRRRSLRPATAKSG